MESSSRLSQWITNIGDFFNDQPWFQQMKVKWEELDPQSREYLKFAGLGTGIIVALIIVIGSWLSVMGLRSEVNEKLALLNILQSAVDESNQLKAENNAASRNAPNASGPWIPYFDGTAAGAGLDKSNMTISNEKSVEKTTKSKDKSTVAADGPKESQFQIDLKHVNIKQIVRFAYKLENGERPVRLKNLTIDTKGDSAGWLDASLLVSAFTFAQKK